MTAPRPADQERLGDRLVQAGVAPRAVVERAATEARHTKHLLGETLVEQFHVDPVEVYRQLAHQRGLVFTDAHTLLEKTDPKLVERFPPRFLEHQRILPIVIEHGRLVVATCDPDAHTPALAEAAGARGVDLRLVTPLDFRRLRVAFDLGLAGKPIKSDSPQMLDVHDLLSGETDLDAYLVALFEAILLDAIAERASDIHLERYGDRVRVRLRIDGDLHDAPHFKMSPDQLRGLVNVVKVSAQLDISEQRLPQGGRFSAKAATRAYDLRVQTQPSLHGEHVIIRLLPQDAKLLSIADLGFPDELAATYRRLLDVPAGLVLVVGPTGSGKSTTLYAGLQVLSKDSTRKVITVEDPIEYAIEDIQQTTARPDLGFKFADAMRSFVREDPDVILVGEIRDGETALEALRASQTGHLVLSTLHCNDAVDAVQRLYDLGMHANSIATELLCVIAQRLAKRNCVHCRAPVPPRADVVAEMFPGGLPEGFVSQRGKGCPRCNLTGTKGRVAVYEFLHGSPALRRAISRHAPVDELRAVALDEGLVPMRDQGLRHVAAGMISVEEVHALLPPERLAPEARKAKP